MIALEYIFWISAFLIIWSYVGYPLILWAFDNESEETPELPKSEDDLPVVDVVFAAYNEESVIEEKIHSIFKSNYPTSKIHVHIGSDASTDKTDELIEGLQQTYDQLHLHRMPGRTGKSGIINYLVEHTSAPLILATDANIYFTPEMIPSMVRNVLRENVSLIGGNIVYRDAEREGISQEEEMYLSFENQIKRRESNLWGFALGVEGGCYLIEREHFTPIPPLTFMEDFFITMSVIKGGKDVYFDTKAVCTEDVSVDKTEEFKRKIRISLGNFQNLSRFATMIVKPFWPLGFAFLSHKVLRWLTPILLLLVLACSIALVSMHVSWIFEFALLFQVILLGIFGIDTLFPKLGSRSSLIRFVGHFYLMNFALFKGLIIYIQGVETNVWQPTKRAQKRS